MARIDIVSAGQTLDPGVSQYSSVYLDGTVWKKAVAGYPPEGIYEGFDIVVTSDSETTVPSVNIDFRFEPSGSGNLSGNAYFTSNSVVSPESIYLVGAFVTQPRLYSYTGAPYGKVYLAVSLVDPKYQTSSMPSPESYNSALGVILTKEDAYVNWFDGATFIYRYVIDRDPSPYWNSKLSYPAELDQTAARLPKDVVTNLVGIEPEYQFTGNFSIHAALTLYEYAERFSITGLPELSSTPLLSWRAKNIKAIAEQTVTIRNPQYLKRYQNASDMFSRVKVYMQDIVKTLYPRSV